MKELVWEPSISRYGADEGISELREALTLKVCHLEFLIFFQLMIDILLVVIGPNEPKHWDTWLA